MFHKPVFFKKLLSYKRLIYIALIMSLISSCSAPRVSNFMIIKDYNESPVLKILKAQEEGRVNYHQNGSIVLSNVPFFQQGNDNTCGQAIMAIILNYWRIDLSYQTIVNQTNMSNIATDIDKITSYLRKYGLYAQDYRLASLNFVKSLIQQGRPVIVLLDFGSLATEHYVVVTGYNDEQQQMIVHDPVDGPNIKIQYADFESKWENRSMKKLGIFGDKYNRIAFDVDDSH